MLTHIAAFPIQLYVQIKEQLLEAGYGQQSNILLPAPTTFNPGDTDMDLALDISTKIPDTTNYKTNIILCTTKKKYFQSKNDDKFPITSTVRWF